VDVDYKMIIAEMQEASALVDSAFVKIVFMPTIGLIAHYSSGKVD